ncbi:Cellulose synthase-like CSLE, family GT2, partial [Zostera marina]
MTLYSKLHCGNQLYRKMYKISIYADKIILEDFYAIFPIDKIDIVIDPSINTLQLKLTELLAIIVMVSCLDEKDDSPLFEAKPARRERSCRRLAIGSTVLGILLILVYRWTHIPTGGKLERFVWIGMFVSEIWFGFYYVLTQACRWNPLYYSTFKDRLSH